MAELKLNHIYKVYPNGTKAVSDFTMDIKDKEFIIFVGPSGCGKSTTLRMIAGLEQITNGELYIDGVLMNDIEPKDRDIAMVFQNYALYPHMTVYDNMAFGLKLRKMPKDEIDKRVKEAAEILGIADYLKKKPKEMSGGQRQRVALGRAIVRNPKVFLLDEPLSNLDAKLRTQMRSEILKLHRKLETTFIYVTHDQVEAMTMGTRIVVMKDGFVQQIDTPRNLYNYPCNKFVAGFIGTPQMNFFNCKLTKQGDCVIITMNGTAVNIKAPYDYFTKVDPVYLKGDKTVVLGLRSEHISCVPNAFPYKAVCRVSHYEDLGTDCQFYGDFDLNNTDFKDSNTKVVLKAPAGLECAAGEIIDVSLDLSHMHLFDHETEACISSRIPESCQLSATVKNNVLNISGAKFALTESIKLDIGEYVAKIPTRAIEISPIEILRAAEFAYVSEENINGTRLLKLKNNSSVIYAIYGGEDLFTPSQKIYVTFDLKQINIYANDKPVLQALNTVNTLNGKLVKRKVKEIQVNENNKEIEINGIVIDMAIGDFAKEFPDDIALRLINGATKNLFEKSIQFIFSPYAVSVSEKPEQAPAQTNEQELANANPIAHGIAAHVENVFDYGTEKFAACNVNGQIINVATDSLKVGDNVMLTVNTAYVSVIDVEREIQLI